MSAVLRWALAYTRRGWPVSPWTAQNGRKFPLTEHGFLDATLDERQVTEWFGKRWPATLVAIATGKPSGIVALDIDIREGGSGLDSLQLLGINFHPSTPTAHTPSGGIHCLFAWPRYYVPCSAGKLGPYIDIRGDGGALILPPGPGRYWDPHLGLDIPIAPMPSWMVIEEPAPRPAPPLSRPVGELGPYHEAALDAAIKAIVEAPDGKQAIVLNREVFSIASLVESGMPVSLALQALQWAASRMPSYDRHRPWRPRELEQKVAAAFTAGLRHPRERRHG